MEHSKIYCRNLPKKLWKAAWGFFSLESLSTLVSELKKRTKQPILHAFQSSILCLSMNKLSYIANVILLVKKKMKLSRKLYVKRQGHSLWIYFRLPQQECFVWCQEICLLSSSACFVFFSWSILGFS